MKYWLGCCHRRRRRHRRRCHCWICLRVVDYGTKHSIYLLPTGDFFVYGNRFFFANSYVFNSVFYSIAEELWCNLRHHRSLIRKIEFFFAIPPPLVHSNAAHLTFVQHQLRFVYFFSAILRRKKNDSKKYSAVRRNENKNKNRFANAHALFKTGSIHIIISFVFAMCTERMYGTGCSAHYYFVWQRSLGSIRYHGSHNTT